MGESDSNKQIIYLTKFIRIDMVLYLKQLIRYYDAKYFKTDLYNRCICLGLENNYSVSFVNKPGILKMIRNGSSYMFIVDNWFLLRVNESLLYYTHEISNITVLRIGDNKEYKFNWIPYGYDKYNLY